MPDNLSTIQIICIILGIIFILWVIYYLITPAPAPKLVVVAPVHPPPHSQSQPQSQSQFTLFNFYSPHCPYSQQFNTVWADLVNQLGSVPNLSLRAIDNSNDENKNLAFYYNVEQVPTIILVGPNRNEEYKGPRDTESVKQFIMSRMQQ